MFRMPDEADVSRVRRMQESLQVVSDETGVKFVLIGAEVEVATLTSGEVRD